MAFNYGAHNRHRLMSAYRVSLISAALTFVIMIAGLVAFQVLPEPMLMLFADTNDAAATATLLELGTPALRIISLSFPCAAFGIITSTLFPVGPAAVLPACLFRLRASCSPSCPPLGCSASCTVCPKSGSPSRLRR